MDDKIVDIMLSDIKDIKSDVKSLLELKNKALGAIICLSAIVTMAFNYLLK